MKHFYTDNSNVNGIGLYTNKVIKKHETVGYIHGPVKLIKQWTKQISHNTANWIGVGRYSWIDTDDSPFRFINHSCEPNVAIVTKRKVIALKNISADTELLMDYSLTEAEPGWSIEHCTCNSNRCRGKIESVSELPCSVFTRYQEYMSANFKKIYRIDNQLKQ